MKHDLHFSSQQIYEPEHLATWFKDGVALLGALDFDEKYQVKKNCPCVSFLREIENFKKKLCLAIKANAG